MYRSLELSDPEVVEDSSALLPMDIEFLSLPAEAIITAGQVGADYNLSFWDSHYAARALLENCPLVSSEDAFDKVEGLKRVKPSDLA